MRVVPKKNYLLLFLMVCFVVLITFVLKNVYDNRHKPVSELYTFLNEVTKEDLNSYLSENDNSIIYIADKYDVSYLEEEKIIKSKVLENDIKDYFVFYDVKGVDKNFTSKFKNSNKMSNKKIPCILIVENKTIKKVYTKKDFKKLNFKEMK